MKLTSLVILLGSIYATRAQNIIVAAPNILRLGHKETVGISIYNYAHPVEVTIILQDRDKKTNLISQTDVVSQGKSKIIELFVDPSKLISSQLEGYQTVYLNLVATTKNNVFPKKEVLIPIIKYGGYVFVQTDKPIYQPTQTVYIRILTLDEKLLPVNHTFTLEITNPKQIRVFVKEILPDNGGITETTFQLPSLAVYGNWTVAVNYGYKFSGRSVKRFTVNDYILPTFSVKINLPKVILDDDRTITGNVEAAYVHGKPVEGFSYLTFKVVNREGAVTNIGVLRDMELISGRTYFTLKVSDIKALVKWFPDIEGSEFLVEATVVEGATGKSSSAVNNDTMFTKSPYSISLDSSLKEFKPGFPYQIAVQIRYANGQLLQKPIQVEVIEAKARKPVNQYRNLPLQTPYVVNDIGRAVFSVNTEFTDEQLEITVKTKDNAFNAAKQARTSMVVTKYASPVANTYVWIAEPHGGTIFSVGELFETGVHVFAGDVKIFNYLVVSKGQIILMNEIHTQNAFLRSFLKFVVTSDMVPSFRLIVYVIKNNHIIADSLYLEVKKACKYNDGKGLSLQLDTRYSRYFFPGSEVRIKVSGEPLSKVCLVAVDEAVYSLSKQDMLFKNMMFDEMRKHDLGEGPGGGINPAIVFRNAGIQVLSNAAIGDHRRQKPNRRTKRSLQDKVYEYTGEQRACCLLGSLKTPEGMNCSMRALKIQAAIKNLHNCSEIFFECCQLVFTARSHSFRGAQLDDDDDDDEELNIFINDVEQQVLHNIRRIFPETWFFKAYSIGNTTCTEIESSVSELRYSAPHSITTWMVQAFGISSKNGMCISDPLRVQVFKPMFIQLELPVSAVRGEQIELMATVSNYGDMEMKVGLYLYGIEGLCMGAGDRSDIQKVLVPANNTVSVMFPVMPLQLGEFPVKVAAFSSSATDAIEKMLKVVPEGVLVEKTMTLTLDPTGFYKRKNQADQLDENVKEMIDLQMKKQMIQVTIPLPAHLIPDTEKCFVSVTGINFGLAVNTTVSGLQDFVSVSTGNGEQTVIRFAPLVYTMFYLKAINRITADIEKTGFDNLWKGYAHALNYRKPDGSFGVWNNRLSSTWLTAFIVKVFCQCSSKLIKIDSNIMCMTISWLRDLQRSTGAFYDAYKVHNVEMTGGVQGEITLTAFVLISIMECNQCQSPDKNIMVQLAVKYLEENVPFLRRPYAVALVAYALSLAKSAKANEANEKLKQMSIFNDAAYERHWGVDAAGFAGTVPWVYRHHSAAVTVETTAYALLTQLVHGDIGYSHAIAKWLNKQRSSKSSFISTQDTVVTLQALAQYTLHTKLPALDMVVTVTSSATADLRKTFNLKPENAFFLHEEEEVPTNGKLHIDVTGSGLATMTITLRYNVEQGPEETCKFDLTVTSHEYDDYINLAVVKPQLENEFDFIPEAALRAVVAEEDQRNKLGIYNEAGIRWERTHVVRLNICMKYLKRQNTGMSIVDVSMFTGYSVVKDDLDQLKRNPATTKLSEYEINQQSILLYLNEVPFSRPLCISFRTAKSVTVGRVQPAPVKIYNSNESDSSCTKFYRPHSNSTMLKKICEGRQCLCYEGLCPSCFPFRHIGEIQNENDRKKEIFSMACFRYDYVWSGTVVGSRRNENFRYIDFEITHVIRPGTHKEDELNGEIVTFVGKKTCSCPVMNVGKKYIVMGQDGRLLRTNDGNIKFKYLLDSKCSVYQIRLLREINDRNFKEKLIQKSITMLHKKFVGQEVNCDRV